MPTFPAESAVEPSDQAERRPRTVSYVCVSRPSRHENDLSLFTQTAECEYTADLMVIMQPYPEGR